MTQTRAQIFEEVKKIVTAHLNPGPIEITENTSFVEDLKADSLDNVEVVMSLEEKFGLSLSDDVAEKLKTIGDVVNLIEKLNAEKAAN